jgi:hypothetical protein
VTSLSIEVVVRSGGEDICEGVPGRLIPYDEALELALRRLRDDEVTTSWRDAAVGNRPAEPSPADPEWTGGTVLSDVRTVVTSASAADVFEAVSGVGGDRGWPAHGWAWRLRGLFDRVVGGVGLRRGRRDPGRLRVGDALDFWRVEALQAPGAGEVGLLRLAAEMRLPGRAWLEWRMRETGEGIELRQRALFAPRGLAGRLYWWALIPFHRLVFGGMVTELARHAEGHHSG